MLKAIRQIRDFVFGLPPLKLLLLGYFSYAIAGWVLLSLPFAWREGRVAALDNLFISTSAVSTV